ncbi:S8 family serine peptidase [Streptomyces scabiei]|uniref:S8 family serine peptidase n=1 Tax=Streptomyces scabiei TaxID=1930 RepID=UPI0029A66DBC|nr:S8 family serine peptidase [Streptomyces scabiei]MDX2538175.1 S8 family serine peptidase [Streptomyces scabiei]MDX2799283.1 S8 family serine peptidase [Streptomyces scabiei]MDX3827930.1 S8 family serine peptidase [Streptomyces scabiei]
MTRATAATADGARPSLLQVLVTHAYPHPAAAHLGSGVAYDVIELLSPQIPAWSRTPKEHALPPKSVRWGLLPALAGAVAVSVAVPGPVAQAVAPEAASVGQRTQTATTVTLITGDRVTLRPRLGKKVPAVSVLPGKGRQDMGFRVVRALRAGTQHISVIPQDAERPLSSGKLDARLFDVTELIRIGRDDARSRSLPLIVMERAGKGASRSALAAHGAGLGRTLRALNGGTLTQPKKTTGGLWQSLLDGQLSSRVSKLWLDGKAKVLDDESNKVIGAPTAWKSGITGKDVLIADLDTGIDANHPDFKGRIAESKVFAGTSLKDGYGHGTHTASTIAGTGAASNGKYAGVAPGARLLVGKVCDDDGACPDSAIIAGMEWAAARHAVAVNMSLGDTVTDGTDPVSTALNRITAQTGTLFVVAAGNEAGPKSNGVDGTVGSPGSADAALTVGSTTKRDTLSYFSSQGPRLGDAAVKPDLVAPGSDIIGARADGTNMDTRVPNPRYEQASGTSMATPHVTGAVALLAQAHPTWKAADFKRVLTSSAHGLKNLTAFQQGSGRLDIVRALKQKVYATSGAASLGLFTWPHAGATATRQITYRNDGDQPVTLELALDAYGPGGKRPPTGMFSLDANSVTVPAHGTATAHVTGRTTKAQVGRYGGAVLATAGDTTVRTAVGLFAEPERHTLTVTGLNREGKPAAGAPLTVFGPRTGIRQDIRLGSDGTFRLRLPEDDYVILGVDDSLAGFDGSGNRTGTRTLLAATGIRTDQDRDVTLDGRKAGKVSARTDRRDATAISTSATLALAGAKEIDNYSLTAVVGSKATLYATPTAQAPGVTYAAFTTLTGKDAGGAYRYSLRQTHKGGIPADTNPVVHDRQLATVHATYASQGGRRAVAVRSDLPSSTSDLMPFVPTLRTALPSRATEYYSVAPGLTWTHYLDLFGTTDNGPDGSLPEHDETTAVRRYRAGHTYGIDWNRAPVGPAVHSATRKGDNVSLDLVPYAARGTGQRLDLAESGMSREVVLSSGGRVLHRAHDLLDIGFAVPSAAKRRYTLAVRTTRTADWTALGTRSTVTWGFTSARPHGSTSTALPLLTVRAGGAVDLRSTAPAGRAFRLPLTVQRPPSAGRPAVTRLALQVSYDDGRTWKSVHVTRRGTTGSALLHHPSRTGYASLRISAADKAGNTVTQTVLRAYRIAPAH